jgi:AAA family ATP:ADP antiporter
MIPSDYKSRTCYPILAVGLSMVAFIVIKTGRDAVFFQDRGLFELPQAYVYIALASLPAAMMHLGAISRWGARRTRTGLFVLAALTLPPFTPFLHSGNSILLAFFVVVPTIFAAVFAGAWLLAGDLLEEATDETKRWAYSRIGAASMIGGVLGGLLAKGLAFFAAAPQLILCGSAILVSVGIIVAIGHRRYPVIDDPAPSDSGSDQAQRTSLRHVLLGYRDLAGLPYLRALVGISGLAAVAALYIDFQFYAAATLTGNNSAQFFANFYIILNAASLLLQLAAAPWLQSRFGVGGALMLLPTALLGSTGVSSMLGTIQARAILRVTEGGLKASIHRGLWEQAFLPIERKRRDMAKVIVDGLFARVAEGIAAACLLVWLQGQAGSLTLASLNWLSWAIIVTVLLWVGVTRYLSRIGCANVSPDEATIRLPDS